MASDAERPRHTRDTAPGEDRPSEFPHPAPRRSRRNAVIAVVIVVALIVMVLVVRQMAVTFP